jgi:hypothetical protein
MPNGRWVVKEKGLVFSMTIMQKVKKQTFCDGGQF